MNDRIDAPIAAPALHALAVFAARFAFIVVKFPRAVALPQTKRQPILKFAARSNIASLSARKQTFYRNNAV